MLLIVLAGTLLCILAAEWILWYLFRGKITGITFPLKFDTSFFRFFTLVRMRMIALVHTVVLCFVSILSLLLLW